MKEELQALRVEFARCAKTPQQWSVKMRKLLATRPARPGAIKEGAWPTWRENLNRKDTKSLQLGPDMSSGWRAFGVQQKPAARLLARCFRDESPHRSCLSHLMPRPLSREHSRHPLKSMSPNSPHVLTTAWKKGRTPNVESIFVVPRCSEQWRGDGCWCWLRLCSCQRLRSHSGQRRQMHQHPQSQVVKPRNGRAICR